MNQRHPSEPTSDHDDHAYDVYSPGAYPTVGTTYADPAPPGYADSRVPGQPGPYDERYAYGYGPGETAYGYEPAGYDTATYATGTYAPATDSTAAYPVSGYETGAYPVYDPYAAGAAPYGAGGDTGTYDTATWQTADTGAWQTAQQPSFPQQEWDSGAYPAAYGYGYGYGYDSDGDTGIYEQVRVPDGGGPLSAAPTPGPADRSASQPVETTSVMAPVAPGPAHDETAEGFAPPASADDEPVRHDRAADEAPTARSRRRRPTRRSALLTVGVPSVAVMGVAAVGAAAFGGVGVAQDPAKSSTDAAAGKAPTTQLDRQLSGVSRDADDFADRASRSQERVDLKDRQAAAKKAAAAAAARKEALRPKYVLPVKQKGLSALYGQAGEHWMALHTGIDFPVWSGTPVMAVTDGTVRTQWNSSYGNMAIVTAPDGTETWYCHLSSTKIRSGKVKAGTVIAYSGNTGNTTGPHLHLEVRPHGGAPIDPLPWLLSHGLDPR